ncbi:MAG: hypothetical protein HY863_12410 [Chloroflexi bacterium]|nr:hypothetical protein [Chloroflexota bacterium]
MRRSLHILISTMILLQACSSLPFQRVANTAAPTATVTLTRPPTATPPATITPTITPSPTILHFPTQDPNLPTATFIPVPIFIGSQTATSAPLPGVTPFSTIFVPGGGFYSVEISENRIFWGGCKPNKAKVIAKVEDPKEVVSVVIFVQLKSALKEDYTPWSTGDVMFNYRDGTFSYTLQGNEIEGHNNYRASLIRFQLVAVNDAGKEIGRTIIYQLIGLSPCM